MPINMMTGKEYSIDYQKMRMELLEMNIFHDKVLQQMYVDRWVAELRKADRDLVKSYWNPQNQQMMLKEEREAPEMFQTIVKMQENEFYIHFCVSRIIQMLEMRGITEADAEEIDIEEFKENKRINWTKTNNYVKRKDPIIIVPFTIGRTYKELVIDGNHRITTAIKNNKRSLKAYFVNFNAVVSNHILSSVFDLLLYVFQNEVVWMGSHYLQNVSDERQLLAKSYFCEERRV